MKNTLSLIILTILLISCSAAPTELSPLSNLADTQNSPIANTLPPKPTVTATQKPTSTMVPSPTATLTPTLTLMPTEDLSFYSVADCIPKNTLYQKGIVTQVMDGDTVDVLFEDGNTYRVRYIGMDAPEGERPYSTESANANADLVLQKQVILIKDVSETDQYDRLLRYVVVDHVFVNLELVRAGHAQAMNYPPDLACADTFASAESAARESFAGIWVATQTPAASDAQVIIVTVNKREEYVDIQNVGNSDVDLAGWKLVSERGNQDCSLSSIIKAGEKLRIWSMTAQGEGFSCGYSSPIWNNSENDPAVLYNAQGVEVSRK
jgi:endonuclease YncB( thermonuclease family)